MAASLATQQRELIEALVGVSSRPAGFDEQRIDAARSALLQKRYRGVQRAWSGVFAQLDAEQFREVEAAFARWAPGAPVHGGWADGKAFLLALEKQKNLPSSARKLLYPTLWNRFVGLLQRRR